MTAAPPPQIFAPARRIAARRRMLALQARPDAPRYILDDMIDDIIDRLGFLRHRPANALVIGDWTGSLESWLSTQGSAVSAADLATDFDHEVPIATGPYDFIACLGTLDTVNDLPGALIHLRGALAPGGLMIASLTGAGSLPALREAMLEADGTRPAPRIHPQVDVRAGGQLLQRAGFADPVIDSRTVSVRFSTFARLIADLRAQALGNVLARPGPPLGKAALERAQQTFAAPRVEEFELLTLSGWKA